MSMKQVMYLGPTMPGVVQENAVFKDGLPKAVSEMADSDKNFSRLLVPVGKVMEAKKQLKMEGSVLLVAYKNVGKNLSPGKEKKGSAV